MKSPLDINKSPLVAIWETNYFCQAAALPVAQSEGGDDPLELSTMEAEKLIRDLAQLEPPIFVFAGADPLKRSDIYQLVHYAAKRNLHPVMALRASPLLERTTVAELRHAGLSRLALTLDAATPEVHDGLQQNDGSYAHTLRTMHWANDWRLPIQINTNVCLANLGELEDVASLLTTFRVLQWNLIFPIPASAEVADELPTAGEFEAAFARLHKIAGRVPFKIKTTEAPHYRRYLLQQRRTTQEEGIPGILPVNEARASLVISHTGELFPGPWLRVSAGNIRTHDVVEVYRTSELFTSLRDPGRLTGKCGECNFKDVCGGSRSRALALAADMFTEDASCIYRPPMYSRRKSKNGASGVSDSAIIPEA